MFDGAIDGAMAKARPMFDALLAEFKSVRAALEADTAADAKTQESNAAMIAATDALTTQVEALRAQIEASAKLAAAEPAK